MQRTTRGFTAVEIAIVLSIAGFVAAFAWPWYQSYHLRAKVADVVAAAGPARATVDRYAAAHGAMPSTAAVVLPFINARHVLTSAWVATGDHGTLTLFTRMASSQREAELDAKAIVWTASYNRVSRRVDWCCGGTPATTVHSRYLPAGCL